MASPLVSVVVPTYNRAHLIGRTLSSALGQTYQNLEIVIVDDGSKDDTRGMIAREYQDEPRVRYVYKDNGGPASARNVGFRNARGEYIALLDSDDTWVPWKLSLQIRCMEAHPELGMTWTDMEMIDAEGRVADPRHLRHMYTAYNWFSDDKLFQRTRSLKEVAPDLSNEVGDTKLRMGNIFSPMIMGNLVHTSTVVLRKERLEKVHAFNETLKYTGEDYDFHLRTTREGPVGLIDLPTIQYQQGLPDRLTSKKLAVFMAENLLRTIEPIVERDRARIDLPDQMIRKTLAKAHAWLAFERLERGELGEARTHYFASLKQWPWQPAIAKPFLFAVLPGGLALRRVLQSWKHKLLGSERS